MAKLAFPKGKRRGMPCGEGRGKEGQAPGIKNCNKNMRRD